MFTIPPQNYEIIKEIDNSEKKLRLSLYRSLDGVYAEKTFSFKYHPHYDRCAFCIIRLGMLLFRKGIIMIRESILFILDKFTIFILGEKCEIIPYFRHF